MASRLFARSLPGVSRTTIRSCVNQTRFLTTPYKKALPSFSMEGKVGNIGCIAQGNNT
jgi:hypothetical protein